MSLPRLWAFLAVALPTLAALVAGLATVDLAYHLRAGAEILDTRAIPTVDSWTFTAAGLPWTDQQWGAQVVLTAVYRARRLDRARDAASGRSSRSSSAACSSSGAGAVSGCGWRPG